MGNILQACTSVLTFFYYRKPQGLEQKWNHENMFEMRVVSAYER